MPYDPINLGSAPDAGDGDTVRAALQKCDAMLNELYLFDSEKATVTDVAAADAVAAGQIADLQTLTTVRRVIGGASFAILSNAITSLAIFGIVSAVTRTAAGSYTVDFTAAQGDILYQPVVAVDNRVWYLNAIPGLSSFAIRTWNLGAGALADPAILRLMIFR